MADPSERSDALSQLVGAGFFCAGSGCFIWLSWVDDWVRPMRLGCGCWIAGASCYLSPPLRSAWRRACASTLARDAMPALAMLSWIVGCAFSFVDDVERELPLINGSFVAGAACLLADAGWRALAQWRRREASARARLVLRADGAAAVCYVLAAAFGGYAWEVGWVRFGMVCWLAGSLLSVVSPGVCLVPARRPKQVMEPTAVSTQPVQPEVH
ncbi:hypothetical protein AB1Y20_009898 [Prymnesium parvum]|uniref:Uncharacterized protein n=1 Tax=Prymnesium parvum TaxID=97485 RepID=A0AB34K2V9_PRYPA